MGGRLHGCQSDVQLVSNLVYRVIASDICMVVTCAGCASSAKIPPTVRLYSHPQAPPADEAAAAPALQREDWMTKPMQRSGQPDELGLLERKKQQAEEEVRFVWRACMECTP